MASILKTVINRYLTSQWFALKADSYSQSLDAGAAWDALLTAGAGESFADVGHSADRGFMVVGDGGGGTPVAYDSGGGSQDFSAIVGLADLVAVAPRINGGYFAYDSAGKTVKCANGSDMWAACGANLPAGGTVEPRALWRDGAIPDLLYFAKGAGGVYKSLDGFGSAGGFVLVRSPGVGSSPAGAVYTMLGVDGLLSTAKITSTTIVSQVASTKAKTLWNGASNDRPPAGWEQPAFDDSGWAAAVINTEDDGYDFTGVMGAARPIWSSATGTNTAERVLSRRSFTLPAGAIASATLRFLCDSPCEGVWINGTFVGSHPSTNWAQNPMTMGNPVYQVAVDPALLLPGATNYIAVSATNSNDPTVGGAHVYRLVVN